MVGEQPTPLTDLAPGIPKALADTVARGLAKEPGARFASIMDFADRLAESAGLSSGPKPAAWIGAHQSVTAAQKETLDAASVLSSESPERRTRPPRAVASVESESRLPIPSVPHSRATPTDELPPIGSPNRRVRQSDRPPPLTPTPSQSHQATRRPQRARLRGSLRKDEASPSERAPESTAGVSAVTDTGTLASFAAAKLTPRAESEALARLQTAMDEVRQAVTFGEDQRALSKARIVLQLAQAVRSREAKELLSSAADLLGPIFLRSLGGLHCKVSLSQPQSSRSSSLSPEHLFLLSRIDGTSTVEELLDVSPLSLPETLGILMDFRDEGCLGFE